MITQNINSYISGNEMNSQKRMVSKEYGNSDVRSRHRDAYKCVHSNRIAWLPYKARLRDLDIAK